MDNEAKNLLFGAQMITIIILGLLGFDFCVRASIVSLDSGLNEFVAQFGSQAIVFIRRFYLPLQLAYVALLLAMALFSKARIKAGGKQGTAVYVAGAVIGCIIFLLGFQHFSLYYNLFVWPLATVSLLFTIPAAVTSIRGLSSSSYEFDKVSSKKDDTYSFQLSTDKGVLTILNPRRGVWIEGGAGAGKSASVVIPIIVQAIQKGFAGVIYDYEGDVTQADGAILTRVAYTAIKHNETPIKFAFINFTDLTKTVRPNVFSTQYIQSYTHAKEIATIIMYNIEREWAKKRDFWANNAIATYAATIWFFIKNHPEYCTLPHVNEFLLNDFKTVLTVLDSDKDVAKYISPVIGALKRNADGQLAGAESSTQLPLTQLRTPEIYYVLNPPTEQEFNLDITNKENPTILCLGNAPGIDTALAPALGAVMQVCKMEMNKLGKNKSVFLIDELPTIYINKLDKLPAEARKKGVCTILAAQTYAQLERDYSTQEAEVIVDNMGNKLIGSSSVKTAKRLQEELGEYERTVLNRSQQDSGSQSISEQNKKEKKIGIDTISNQSPGHFTGTIAGGTPPTFSTQVDYYEYPTEPIPAFNTPIQMNDEEVLSEIMNKLIRDNYTKIQEDVNGIISQYQHLLAVQK